MKQVSIGGDFACAVKKLDSSLQCWGNAPALPESFIYTKTTFTQVSVGGNYACAIYNQGNLKCWGNDDYKQLSVPTFKGKVLKVSAGSYRTCAINEQHNLQCWGNESEWNKAPPESLGNVIDLSIGSDDHVCAIRSDRSLVCWGGDPHSADSIPPSGLNKVYQVATGVSFTCTIDSEGRVSCWGGITEYDGADAIGKVIQWSLGKVGCAVTEVHQLRCWGRYSDILPNSLQWTNIDSVTVSQDVPMTVCQQSNSTNSCIQNDFRFPRNWSIPANVLIHVTSLPPEFSNTQTKNGVACYEDKAPGLVCASANSVGGTPFEILLGSGIELGYGKVCTINPESYDETREIYCHSIGQLLHLQQSYSVGHGKQVSIGFDNVCFIDLRDTPHCVDKNLQEMSIPTNLVKVKKIVAGNKVNCAISSNALLKCWGSNENQLLDIPSEVKQVKDVQIAESGTGICAQLQDGTLRCWGTIDRFMQTPLLGKLLSKAKGISSVSVAGTFKVGQKLNAVAKSLDAGSSLTYVWKRGSELIKGATTSSYSVLNADKGKSLSVEVTAFKPGFTVSTKVSKSEVVR